MDDVTIGGDFFGVSILPLVEGTQQFGSPLVITSLKRRNELRQTLYALGVSSGRIYLNNTGMN